MLLHGGAYRSDVTITEECEGVKAMPTTSNFYERFVKHIIA
jgi:hypothetical protein